MRSFFVRITRSKVVSPPPAPAAGGVCAAAVPASIVPEAPAAAAPVAISPANSLLETILPLPFIDGMPRPATSLPATYAPTASSVQCTKGARASLEERNNLFAAEGTKGHEDMRLPERL